MLLPEVSNPLPVWLERSGRLVGRPVVADDHLERRQLLCERRLHRVGDGSGRIVGGDDDGKRRHPAALKPAGRGRHPKDAARRYQATASTNRWHTSIVRMLIMTMNANLCKGQGLENSDATIVENLRRRRW